MTSSLFRQLCGVDAGHDKVEKHKNAVGQCYRCDTIVEPIESLQWFVKMRPLADLALAALERGEPKFHPERWASFYKSWLVDVAGTLAEHIDRTRDPALRRRLAELHAEAEAAEHAARALLDELGGTDA